MQLVHMITVKYLGPTNRLGSRIKLTSGRFDNDSVTLSYDYGKNSIVEMAIDWLENTRFIGSKVLSHGNLGENFIVTVDVFEPLKELGNN